jgi:hypothetical protein
MKLLGSLFAIAIIASAAHADSKSFSAVKGLLPDNVVTIGGANVATLRGTSLYQTVIPALIAKKSDVKKAFDLAKSHCGIDLHAAVVDATIALSDDEHGIIVATLDKSIDQKRVVECMTKVTEKELAPKAAPAPVIEQKGGLKAGTKKADPAAKAPTPATPPPPAPTAPKVVTKTTGKITEYGLDNDPSRIYVAWLAADVVAIATTPDDKALLDKMLAGKGAPSALAKFMGKANMNHAIWFASTKSESLDTGGSRKGGFGTINTAKGNVDIDMTVVTTSVKDAKAFVASTNDAVSSVRGGVPPQFTKLVDALKITAEDDRAKFKFSAPEKDLVALLAMLLMGI